MAECRLRPSKTSVAEKKCLASAFVTVPNGLFLSELRWIAKCSAQGLYFAWLDDLFGTFPKLIKLFISLTALMHYEKHLLCHLLTCPYLHKGLTRFLQIWLNAVYMKEIKYRKGGECAHTTEKKKQTL